MRYLLAILLPPVAVLFCGKPFQFVLNIILTLCFWIPGVIHAILIVNSHLADKRTTRLEKAIRESAALYATKGGSGNGTSDREAVMHLLAGDPPAGDQPVTENEQLPLYRRILERLLSFPPHIETKERDGLVLDGNSDEIWHKLVDVLGLQDGRLSLPHFRESKNPSPDALSEGMRLEVVGLQGTPCPAQLATWKPNERQLAVSLIDEAGLPSRTYSFSVQSTSQAGQSEIQLTVIHRLPFIHQFLGMIINTFGRSVNFAEMVLRMIADPIRDRRGRNRAGLPSLGA